MNRSPSDAIVIGAGVQGTSVAFQLARRGLRVTIIERTSLGAGATGTSSGFIRMHYDLESESRLAWESFRWFKEWHDLVGHGDPGFVRTGFLQLVEPAYESALRRNVAMQQRLGINTEVVSGETVRDIAPGLDVSDVTVAAYEPDSGYGDPTGTADGFLKAARDHGATFHRGVAVTGIRTSDSKITGIRTAEGDIDAPIVVLAAGAWSAVVACSIGLDLPVTSWREHTAYFVVPDGLQGRFPAVIDDITVCSFRPEGTNLLLAGVEDANVVGVPPDSELPPMPLEFIERLAGRLSQRMPLMASGGLMSSQCGQDGLTPDQRPILGPAGPDGLFLSCGFSGTGFKTAPAIGLCLAEEIVDGRAVTVDIKPYTLDRFSSGRLLVGDHAYPALWREAASTATPDE